MAVVNYHDRQLKPHQKSWRLKSSCGGSKLCGLVSTVPSASVSPRYSEEQDPLRIPVDVGIGVGPEEAIGQRTGANELGTQRTVFGVLQVVSLPCLRRNLMAVAIRLGHPAADLLLCEIFHTILFWTLCEESAKLRIVFGPAASPAHMLKIW